MNIQELKDTFERHAEKYDLEQKERHEKYPDRPKYENFNLATALKIICDEIIRLKNVQ